MRKQKDDMELIESDGYAAGDGLEGDFHDELSPSAPEIENDKADMDKPRVFVYLGPTIRGVITNGSIFTGSKKDILTRFAEGVKTYPDIERLIVPDRSVAKAREMLANGEGVISVTFKKLKGSISK